MTTALFETKAYVSAQTEKWCSDDWETPDCIAEFMASLLTGKEFLVWEPFAGTGQILQYLPPKSAIATERNLERAKQCQMRLPTHVISAEDAMDVAKRWKLSGVDCIITNPPFSVAAEMLKPLAKTISNAKEKGRILLLLPSEFFQSQARARLLKDSGLCITQQWAIAGRIAFLKNGVPENKRQCYDSVFELKLSEYCEAAVKIVDPMGRLTR